MGVIKMNSFVKPSAVELAVIVALAIYILWI